jgi:hypothetical protein
MRSVKDRYIPICSLVIIINLCSYLRLFHNANLILKHMQVLFCHWIDVESPNYFDFECSNG